MIDLNAEATTIIVIIFGQLIVTIPLAFGLLRAWMRIKENELRISARPTQENVNQQINGVVSRLLNESNGTGKG